MVAVCYARVEETDESELLKDDRASRKDWLNDLARVSRRDAEKRLGVAVGRLVEDARVGGQPEGEELA